MYGKENRRFGLHLSIILRRGQMYLDRELKPFGVRAGQLPILWILGSKDGINQEGIRKFLHLDKGTIAKTIRPLINGGYVVRERDPDDKRAYRIFLTRKGRDILPKLRDATTRWTDAITEGFTEEEKDAAYALLSRMSENAREYLKRGSPETAGKA